MARPLIIPILGNTSELEAALLKAGVVAEDASKKISGSFRAAGLSAAEDARMLGASVQEQAAAAGRAAAAFTDMSAKITTSQRNAGKAAAAAAGQVGASVDEQRAAYARAIATQAEYEAAQKRAADVAKKAAADQAAAAAAAARAAEDASKRMVAAHEAAIASASKRMASLGKWTLAGGLGIGYESVKGAMDLQRQMEMLHTQAGASQAQVGALTKGALSMAGSVGTGPDQLAQGLYHVVSAMNKMLPAASRTADELKILKVGAEGAKIGGADLDSTMYALTSTLAVGLKGTGDYAKAMGILNATVGAGDMRMQDLVEALPNVTAYAANAGVGIKDLGAALATMGDYGLKGAEAGTKLASAIRIMGAPSKEAAKALAVVNLSTLQLANDMRSGGLIKALEDLKQHLVDSGATATQQALILNRAFGGRQSGGVRMLIDHLDRLRASYKQVDEGGKSFGKDYQATTHTLAFQMDQLKATVQALADKFGMFLIPKLEAAGQAVQSVIGWLERHKAAADALAVTIGLTLGTAITVFAYTKAVAFVKGTEDMVIGLSKVASFATGGLIPALERTGPAITDIGVKSSAAAAEVEASDAQIEAANTTAAASFESLATTASTIGVEVDGSVAAMASAIETADAAIVAANDAVKASWLGLLGPMGMVATAAAAAYALAQNTPTETGPGPFKGGYSKAAQRHAEAEGWTFSGGQWVPPFNGGYYAPRGSLHHGGVPSTSMTPSTFAVSVLEQLGIAPTTQNVRDFTAWEQQEGGNWHNTARYNPLNTTQPEPGAGNTGTQGNIKSYRSWAQGLAATVATLENGKYGAILNALKGDVSLPQFSAIVAGTPWGTGSIHAPGVGLSQSQLAALGIGGARSKAAATSAIPVAVATMLSTALALQGTRYTWGGGHGGWDPVAELKKIGVDCSGFVSQVLHMGGVSLPGPMTTEGLASNLQKGRGRYFTVWDRSTGAQDQQHTLIDILGKWFESGGKASPGGVSEITSRQAAQELAGGGFNPYHANVGGPMATVKQLRAMGLSNVTLEALSAASASFNQTLQNMVAAVTKAADSLIQKYGNLEQSGTLRTLTGGLGITTSGRIGGQLHQIIARLGGAASLSEIDRVSGRNSLTSVGERASAHSPQEASFMRVVEGLIATGQTKLADRLIAAHRAAMMTWAQEAYAQQVLKDGEMLQLQATELQDQTRQLTNWANDMLQVTKAQYQRVNDAAQAQVTAVRDMSQTVTDTFAGMTQAVQDAAQAMTDSTNAVVQGIQDQTQIRVDVLGERGLYGLNLLAQQQKVALDVQRAADDRKIALAQQNLDSVTANWHAAENTAQLNLDQVTAQQHQLVALAQQRADTVAVKQAVRLASAQARVDALTLHEDATVIGPAQIAVDMNATAPKAQQDVFANQLKKAMGSAGLAEGKMDKWFQGVQSSVNSITAAAEQSAAAAQNTADLTIAQAQQYVDMINGEGNYYIALAQAGLSGAQGSAALNEAPLAAGQQITTAEAQTQYAGSGMVIQIYGENLLDPTEVAQSVGWTLRTLVPS